MTDRFQRIGSRTDKLPDFPMAALSVDGIKTEHSKCQQCFTQGQPVLSRKQCYHTKQAHNQEICAHTGS